MKRKLLVLSLVAGLAVAQIPGIPIPLGQPVYDLTAIGQLIKQLEQALTTYQMIVNQYNQMLYQAKTLGNLRTFHSNWSLWYLVNAANTYGYNTGWVNVANGGQGGGYYGSVLPLPVYGGSLTGLAPGTLQRVQYQYSQAQLADSVAQNTLHTTGAIRSSASGTETALANLSNSVLDPGASEVQVLQKISAGALIQARTQNDSNKVLAAAAETAAFQAKLRRDEIQAAAVDYQEMLARQPEVTAATANASQAIQSFRFSSIP